MDFSIEAWLVLAAIAALGIGAMLLTMAAAIRRGVAIIELETRVRTLQAQHRQRLIERGLIEPDEDEIVGVEVMDDDDDVSEAVAIDDEPTTPQRRAA